MAGAYGFSRGFEEFSDTPYARDEDVVRTFDRGLRFLEGLQGDERFFLFLHTYSIHDPYLPPPEYRHAFWDAPPLETFEPDGERLNEVNRGFRDIDRETVEYFEALYDGSILYVDSVLESFFARLERLGLADDTTVIITSDHGEEFLEHGKMVHEQIYPENLFVPLIVAHPDLDRAVRVGSLVQSIDLVPTLYQLAGIAEAEDLPGRSLVPYFESPETVLATEAYAEVAASQTQKSLLTTRSGDTLQLVLSELLEEPDGSWVPRSVDFDTDEERLDLRMISFKRPRQLHISLNGQPLREIEVPNRWRPFQIDLKRRPGGNRVTFATPECEWTEQRADGEPRRCLAIKVRGVNLRRSELFDLSADPGALQDRYRQSPDLRRRLHSLLREYRWEPIAESAQRQLDTETRQTLEALGYLQ